MAGRPGCGGTYRATAGSSGQDSGLERVAARSRSILSMWTAAAEFRCIGIFRFRQARHMRGHRLRQISLLDGVITRLVEA